MSGCSVCGRGPVVTEANAAGGPPEDVLRYMRSKRVKPSQYWWDTWRSDHRRNFVLAGVEEAHVLSKVAESLIQVVERGGTYEEWAANIGPTLRKLGYGHLTSAWRATLIYQQNLNTAHSAENFKRFSTNPATPYARYTLGPVKVAHRDTHAALAGLILPWSHPFWEIANPPNGYLCHCSLQPLTALMAKRYGYDAAEHEARVAELPQVEWEDPRRPGRTITLPAGIEPGFNWNPASEVGWLSRASDWRAEAVAGLMQLFRGLGPLVRPTGDKLLDLAAPADNPERGKED